jgi:nitrite reductase (cytochrome c-552)
MLKAQHPDYEHYKTGIHAERGVACADCHMPYKREGGLKFTNHHLVSPLNNISGSCQVCHRESEETLRHNVHDRQSKVSELRRIVENHLARLHLEAKVAWDAGATEEDMKEVLQLIRHSQWRWDWVAAANSMGFHSPNESLRTLATSIDKAQDARILLARVFNKYGVSQPVGLPDFSTKEKAQQILGLDMQDLRRQKDSFLENELPQWLEEARQREELYHHPRD